MRILHVTPSLSYEWGGPTKVVTGLTGALARKGVEVSVFAPSENDEELSTSNVKEVNVRLFPKGFLSRFWPSYSSPMAKALMKQISDFDLVHIHEIWHHPHFAAYRAAKSARKHFIITIHGELEPWCLEHKGFKKKIYSTLIQRKILKQASALHAITEQEIKNIANYVDNKNVFLVPNAINLDDFENLPHREKIENLYPDMKGKRVILFLGRVHPKKGLDILAEAFGSISKKRDDIQLVIAGPDSKGYKREIVEILRAHNALNNTIFTGMLTGDKKLAVLSRADIFVLPSYSEVLGISTLEAMACGLPVVITKQCNFPEVEKIRAGKVIDADVAHLSEALIELLDNPDLCKEMGERGKRLVKEKYTWDKLADKMITAYEEILGRQKVVRDVK